MQTVWGATTNGTYFFIIKSHRCNVHDQLLRAMGIKPAAYNDRDGRSKNLRQIRRRGVCVVKLRIARA